MATKTQKAEAKNNAIAQLRRYLRHGSIIYSYLVKISTNGVGANYAFFVSYDGRVINITRYVAAAAEFRLATDENSLRVPGYGFNRPFHAVEILSHVMRRPDEVFTLRHEDL